MGGGLLPAIALRCLFRICGGSTSSASPPSFRPPSAPTRWQPRSACSWGARTSGYWTSAEIIPITADLASEDLIGLLLAGTYDAVLASKPQASGAALAAAQQLVRTIRLRGGGFTVSAAGFGAGGTNTQAVSSPPGALVLDGPRVLHLNNLENLSEVNAARALARARRGDRRSALAVPG
ncbi:MAG: hypothetical protein DCF24_11220 [Cyanobium sp.]|nr:MAG: hypothetical protein DCF24_11220 [Cyanobium sp.]